MSDRYSQRRRLARSRLTTLAALVAAAALGAAAFAFFTSGSGSDAEKKESGRQNSTQPPTFSAPPTQGTTQPTVLPKPKTVADGVPVGYPHTLNGAVSAAAHFYDTADLFDPTASQRQARITAAPGKAKELGDEALRLSMAARRDAGLTLVGESSTANYYALSSRAYRVDSATEDRVTVWILTDTELSVHGVAKSDTAVQTAVLTWSGGDWKFTGQEGRDDEPKPVVPESAQAVREGWRSLAYTK
ncbi:hypothetical protein [Streptomyces malaysiensis]|uniref:hypothetical protein n=1 Tax=Streptomyces malaysiensis TaxID=92644 RepID=UPI000BFC3DF7|nr:hypothetical protein [Streptomyces malaysiensis]ATL88789.1 hypothetical protein SMALA_8643 [Streptomyces malaysiensis]